MGDLRLKDHIERMEFPEGGEKKMHDGRLLIRRHHNRGMAFNIAEGKHCAVAAVSVAVTLVITVIFLFSLGRRGNHLLRAGLSLLLGGAFSNTYDRLRRRFVVDYLSFGVGGKRFRRLIFNISDFCILIGALLAALGAAQ